MSKQSDTIKRSGIKQTKEYLKLKRAFLGERCKMFFLLGTVEEALGSRVGQCDTLTEDWSLDDRIDWCIGVLMGDHVSVEWDSPLKRENASFGIATKGIPYTSDYDEVAMCYTVVEKRDNHDES